MKENEKYYLVNFIDGDSGLQFGAQAFKNLPCGFEALIIGQDVAFVSSLDIDQFEAVVFVVEGAVKRFVFSQVWRKDDDV